MCRIKSALLALLLGLVSPWCAAVSLLPLMGGATLVAAATPVVSEPQAAVQLRAITFVGNKTTRPCTLLRELSFKTGDWVTAAQLEAGRQAIQNLNLFKQVTLVQRFDAEGRVEAVYGLDEKWYVLGYPRVDANSNGEYAYGAQLDWNNLWGLNHTLRASALRKETKRVGVGMEQNLVLGYAAPQVFDSLWSVGLGGSYTERPVSSALGQYSERLEGYQALASRALDAGNPNQGWSLGAGALWTRQHTSTGMAQYGDAFGPVGILNYRDLKFNIYSEEGLVFSSRTDAARESAGADYDFLRISAAVIRYWRVGATPHQTVHVFGDTGLNWAGPNSVRNFTLGGVGGLRGYERGYREGNAYFRVGTEWARPIFRPWLRAVVIAEAGHVYAEPNEIDVGKVRGSMGFGLRLRLPMFVNVEVEAGIALPLDGGKPKFFAGQV